MQNDSREIANGTTMFGKWSKQRTVLLLRSVKIHPCLWNSSSKHYKDKTKKGLAWSSVEKDVGVPVEVCKSKIESLLASFRREKLKIRTSEERDPENVYVPKWIFWKEMNFMRGLPDESCDSVSSSEGEKASPKWSPSARRPHRNRPRKPKLNSSIPTSTQFYESESKYSKTIFQKETDEYDAFGITVASKLRKMDETQRLYAENIINRALYKGLTFQLNVQSDIELLKPRIVSSHSENREHLQSNHHPPQQATVYFQQPSSVQIDQYDNKDINQITIVAEDSSENYKSIDNI